MRTAIRQARTVATQAMRPRSTRTFSPPEGMVAPAAPRERGIVPVLSRLFYANCGKVEKKGPLPPVPWEELGDRWAGGERSARPGTVLTSEIPTPFEGGASDEV